MKPLFTLILLLLSLTIISCDDASLITREAIQDAGSCFENLETTDDMYIVSLDRNCVDMELSVPPPVPTDPTAQPTVIERDWELVATLERDLYQRNWHQFHVYDHDKENILTAFRDGKDLLFELGGKSGQQYRFPIRFYHHQPEPPTIENNLFYPSHGWFKDERKSQGLGDTPAGTIMGLAVHLDPGFPGWGWANPENNKKKWVSGGVKFWVTYQKDTTYTFVHIGKGHVLRVYAR